MELGGERLVKLRNPWGRFEWPWKGSFGDADLAQKGKELQRISLGLGPTNNANDGTFWISFTDFLRYFQKFTCLSTDPTGV